MSKGFFADAPGFADAPDFAGAPGVADAPGCAAAPSFAHNAARLAGMAGVVLGWRPDDFWRATPAELASVIAALHGEASLAPPARAEIERLMEIFPDG